LHIYGVNLNPAIIDIIFTIQTPVGGSKIKLMQRCLALHGLVGKMVKKNPKKQEIIPVDSVIIDYGTTRVILPYRVYVKTMVNNKEMDDWCAENVAEYKWLNRSWTDGYMYFVKSIDATMFKLKWT
jgi:hypothetical protein